MGLASLNCKWCGSDEHASGKCPTRNLVIALTTGKIPKGKLPKYVSIMPFDDLLKKSEKELNDEVKALRKVKK